MIVRDEWEGAFHYKNSDPKYLVLDVVQTGGVLNFVSKKKTVKAWSSNDISKVGMEVKAFEKDTLSVFSLGEENWKLGNLVE